MSDHIHCSFLFLDGLNQEMVRKESSRRIEVERKRKEIRIEDEEVEVEKAMEPKIVWPLWMEAEEEVEEEVSIMVSAVMEQAR